MRERKLLKLELVRHKRYWRQEEYDLSECSGFSLLLRLKSFSTIKSPLGREKSCYTASKTEARQIALYVL